MLAKKFKLGLVLSVATAVAACANQTPHLLNVGATLTTPDEFGILPGKPLQTPDNYTDLPAPTPNGQSRTDPTPHADAVAALGGNPAVLNRSGIDSADAALLALAQRRGVAPNVRQELSDADLAFRRGQGLLFFMRWVSGNRYFSAYRGQSLDPFRELERLRAAGVQTPSAPPRTQR